MEHYSSTCTQCHHQWNWVGYKTGMGKTEAQLAEMRVAGTVCPRCNGPAKVGLDHESPGARATDARMGALVGALFGGAPREAAPVPTPAPEVVTPEVPPPKSLPQKVYDAVQAALLNSECDPVEAVTWAQRAVDDFAEAEDAHPAPDVQRRPC